MKKILITFFVMGYSLALFGQAKKEEITPKKSVAKVVLTGKKNYTYYALSAKSKTEYRVSGPGKLFVNVRVRIEDESFKSLPFKLKYIRSDHYVKTESIPELITSNLKFKNETLTGHPSRLYQIEIDVPPGTQTYRFYKYKTEQKSHIRAFYIAHPKPEWIDIEPSMMLSKKEVRFVKSGNTKSYYEITKQTGFDFSVTDTSRIRVIVRPEFTYNMLEETILKIKVQNMSTGRPKIYKIDSDKSDKLEFVNEKKLTPGTSKTFYLNLPKPGNNTDTYSISLMSGAKAAVIRLSNDKNLMK